MHMTGGSVALAVTAVQSVLRPQRRRAVPAAMAVCGVRMLAELALPDAYFGEEAAAIASLGKQPVVRRALWRCRCRARLRTSLT